MSFLISSSPFLGIIFAVLVFFYPVWLRGHIPIPGDFIVGVYYPWLDYKWGFPTGVPVKNPITTDVVSLIYPMQMFAVDLIKSGHSPLWNPFILFGTPLLANFQSAPFSPTNFLYFFFDKLTSWTLQIVLQHILAAGFSYLLLRHWKVSKIGAFLGGIIFAFSGFNLIWSQWNGHVLTSAFIPLILLFEDRWLEKRHIRDGVLISVFLGLQILSGYPPVVMYTIVAMGLLWAVKILPGVLTLGASIRSIWPKTLFLALFGILGVSLAGFQVLPGYELSSLSQRGFEPIPLSWALLPWNKVITFVAPDYFGNHATGNYWGPQDYTSNTGFVGIVTMVFAGFSFKLFKKSRAVTFLFLLLLTSLILSFPTPLSIFLWENDILGMRASSGHRALVLFNLAVALLAGFGVDYYLSSAKQKLKLPFLLPYLIIGGFGITTLYLFFVSRQNPEAYESVVRGIPKYFVALRNLVLPTITLLFVSLVLWFSTKVKDTKKWGLSFLSLLMFFELFRFGWKFTPFSPRNLVFPQTPVLEFLTSQEGPFRVTGSTVIPVNLRTPYGLESPEGYETVHSLRVSQFLAALNSGVSGATPTGRYGIIDNDTSRLLDLVNTKYYLVVKKDEAGLPSPLGSISNRFEKSRFKVAFEDRSVAVLESKSALPRAFMVYDWEIITRPEEQLTRLLDKDFPLNKKVILEVNPGIEKGQEAKFSIDKITYGLNRSSFDVSTEKPGILFVSDAWFPGWKAFVDGRETDLLRANHNFRAVVVSQGEHTIQFIYDPRSFKIGLLVSVATALFLVALFVVDKHGIAKRIRFTK